MLQESPSPEFLAIVRGFLRHADPALELKDDTDLAAQGLDSLAAIGLLLSLEESYETRFKDEDVTTEIFYSPAALWQALSRAGSVKVVE